jgi:hypothetical protein
MVSRVASTDVVGADLGAERSVEFCVESDSTRGGLVAGMIGVKDSKGGVRGVVDDRDQADFRKQLMRTGCGSSGSRRGGREVGAAPKGGSCAVRNDSNEGRVGSERGTARTEVTASLPRMISLALDEDHAACAMAASPTRWPASTLVPSADPGRGEGRSATAGTTARTTAGSAVAGPSSGPPLQGIRSPSALDYPPSTWFMRSGGRVVECTEMGRSKAWRRGGDP